MKKIFMRLFLIISILLTACGSETVGSKSESSELIEAPKRAYNENMSIEEFTEVTNATIEFATDLSNIFSQMASMSEKYADTINSAETFDWSQYWDFRETKADAITTCDKILAYDDSICSKEYQTCLDECKSMAFQIKQFYITVSKEMAINELNTLTQNLSNDVSLSMNYAMVYQTLATIAYMEANDGDPDAIQALRLQVEDNYIYKVTTGEYTASSGVGQSSTKNVIFTNSYGAPTTKCAHSGCTNAIATSGDTNCCITHSNKCFNCGKYVDEDAMFCMDCLNGKTTSITDTGKYNSSSASKNGCQYTYFDGSVCGKSTNNYASLCDSHFKELHDTYESLVGR